MHPYLTRAGYLVLAVVAALVVTLAGYSMRTPPGLPADAETTTPAQEPSATPSSFPEPSVPPVPSAPPVELAPSFAVVGDAVSAGWPAMLAERTGLPLDGVEITPGMKLLPSAQALTASGITPSFILVSGSFTDAAAVFSYLATAQPQARTLVVGPAWPTWAASAGNRDGIRLAMKAAARAADLRFRDPQLGKSWFNDTNRNLIGPDNLTPNRKGNALIAQKLARLLAAVGATS
jgi:hypothetical protein